MEQESMIIIIIIITITNYDLIFPLKILVIYILFVFVPHQNIPYIISWYLTKYYTLLLSNHFTFTFTSRK